MFLDIKPHKRTENSTAVDTKEAKKREKEKLLLHLGIREGWQVLVIWPGSGEELALLARLVGPRGELVVVDSSGDCLESIETRKQNVAYQATAYVGQAIHPEFSSSKKVDVSVNTLEFNGRSLAFPADSFDAVWCPGVKAGVTAVAQEALIREFYRVVRPGGSIAFCQPQSE